MNIQADLRVKRKQIRRERDAMRGRLGKDRFGLLVKELVAVIRLAFEAGATGSLFGLEGPLRAGIRADLCRQGWNWQDADSMAREMLDEAFRGVRAIRPSWNEGQPEWAVHAGTLIERTFCANCHAPLPDGKRKFCDRLCHNAFHGRLTRRKQAQDERAVKLAIKAM